MMSPGTDADASDVSTGSTSTEMASMSRRRFIAGTTGVAAMTGTAGCASVLGSSGKSEEEVTIVLTPENPTDIKKDYMPMQRYLEDQISDLEITFQVPTDYSAIRPALTSKQAEIAMDDITLIGIPDKVDVMGTAVTGGTPYYFSLMMTKPESNIEKPADVAGKSMAFADPLSTSGSIYALWELQNAGLDLGQAPGSDEGADFTGNWSNHKSAIEQLINGKVDACSTWGGTGMAYVPESDVPGGVMEKTAYVSELGSKSPALDVFLYSKPIPKQPVINRSTWDSPLKEEITNTLYKADDEVMKEYKPDDYEGTMPFTTLNETSKSDYQPVIKRVNDLGIDLTQE